ncbi:MAG: dihydroorotate dehydrogenase electron transfer subunit [Candidatus Azobacteroides sp.]|nr:dihydroorotate dehydrogenase electron transfer subunit [Candidatus Azobacteroides sp.]
MRYIDDWIVKENIRIHDHYSLLKLTIDKEIPEMMPGQFVQVRVDDSPSTFLRRPISIHFIDRHLNELWLLVQLVGDGTRRLAKSNPGDSINLIYPLGNGFSLPEDIFTSSDTNKKLLLVGGGVGVAPLLHLGAHLFSLNYKPLFLLGARSQKDLLQLGEFRKYGTVYLTTEDGSCDEKGFVTNHSILKTNDFDYLYTCGPKPMMIAVAKYARQHSIEGEVSLENLMACGMGACLCCVEKTIYGNVRACTEGPIININALTWQI